MEPVESATRIDAGGVDDVAGPVRAWIATVGDEALHEYPAKAAAVAAEVLRRGGRGAAACRALTGLHDVLTTRLIRLAEAELGPPPGPYAWLALGSGGRMEQSLHTDQDHAIVSATDGPDAAAYFAALGARTVDGLARAGMRRCPGGYMADKWHLALPEWQALFGRWIDRPEPAALVEAEVFLDFRPVHGTLPVTALEAALRRGSDAPRFLVAMARAAVRFAPPLGFAGRVLTRRREVDLKRAGLAGVVLLARLYALAAGSLARSTPERLTAAAVAGTLSRSGADALAEGYRVLTDLRLAAQLRAGAAGEGPTNRVRLDDLTTDERRGLRRALHAVRDTQRATALRFRTDTVL